VLRLGKSYSSKYKEIKLSNSTAASVTPQKAVNQQANTAPSNNKTSSKPD
jgi:hypothetical protein